MFDNLRENQHTDPVNSDGPPDSENGTPVNRPRVGFLGMTSGQRFAVAILLLVAICVLGATCLLATGAIRAF
jgi:hypothetical protein